MDEDEDVDLDGNSLEDMYYEQQDKEDGCGMDEDDPHPWSDE